MMKVDISEGINQPYSSLNASRKLYLLVKRLNETGGRSVTPCVSCQIIVHQRGIFEQQQKNNITNRCHHVKRIWGIILLYCFPTIRPRVKLKACRPNFMWPARPQKMYDCLKISLCCLKAGINHKLHEGIQSSDGSVSTSVFNYGDFPNKWN